MTILQFEPTELAEWRKLILEGQQKAGLQLTESIENYVVITLKAHTVQTNLASVLLAIDFLKNIHIHSTHNFQSLRTVGDQCLILAGLFPERVKRKQVSAEYFKNLGENAYYVLSFADGFQASNRALFYQLFESFSDLIEVLRSTRMK